MPRPSEFTQDVADAICEKLADGNSLRSICAADDMPARSTVFKWLADPAHSAFVDQYARAREAQAEALFEDILDIADDGSNDYTVKKRPDGSEYDAFDAEHVQRSKLRVDARKWMVAKLAPKKYGDRVELEHSGGINLTVTPDDAAL